MIDRYFEMLTDPLNSNGLMHKPMQVYNCDETGMPLGAYHHKVVAQAGLNPTCITMATVANCKSQFWFVVVPLV